MNSTLLLIAVAAALAVVAVVGWHRLVKRRSIERDFRVFAMTSRERQEALIKGWRERRKCSRV
jgi:hypothetical protein